MEEISRKILEYNELNKKILELNDSYTTYLKSLARINSILKEDLNKALPTNDGNRIIELWDNYYSRINNFNYIFHKWNTIISQDENYKQNISDLKTPSISKKYNREENNTSFEELINNKYNEYLNGVIDEMTWKTFIKRLPKEQKQYAKYLPSLKLDVENIEDILVSILSGTYNSNSMAEIISKKNQIPKGYILLDSTSDYDPFLTRNKLANDFYEWLKKSQGRYPLLDRNTKKTKFDSYFVKNGNTWKVFINNKEYKEFIEKPSISDYKEMWNIAFPNYYQKTYSVEGEKAYNIYRSKIPKYWSNPDNVNRFKLSINKDIYFNLKDGKIYYPDNTSLQIYEDDLLWTLDLIFKNQDKINYKAIKELFMIANGYITYKPSNKYNIKKKV